MIAPRLKLLAQLLIAATFVVLAVRQLHFVAHYSVNVFYLDQWDFYEPLFQHQGWWATFDHQHGPHRQGLGFVVTRILAGITGWNARWDSIACSWVLICAAALGLALARRFGIARWSLTLVAVPLIFLNVHQFEIFVGPSNLSHGVMPMLLFMGFCLVQFLRDYRRRLALTAALTFFLIFTGFGIFVGVIAPLLLLVEAFQAAQAHDRSRAGWAASMLLLIGLSWVLFAQGYTFQPAVPHFRFPYERPSEYFVFVARMFGNFFGLGELSALQLALGAAVAAALAVIALAHGGHCLRKGVAQSPRSAVLFCLSAYVLLYCANTAVGRVFVSPEAPLAPRYVTLLIPGALALYLQIALIRTGWARLTAAAAFTLLLIPATAFLRADEMSSVNLYSDGRRRWKKVYQRTHSQEQADREAHFIVYPGDLTERLKFLEEHRLNLFVP